MAMILCLLILNLSLMTVYCFCFLFSLMNNKLENMQHFGVSLNCDIQQTFKHLLKRHLRIKVVTSVVQFVTKRLPKMPILKDIQEYTLVLNLTLVQFSWRLLVEMVLWKTIWKFIVERGLIHFICVQNHLHIVNKWKYNVCDKAFSTNDHP